MGAEVMVAMMGGSQPEAMVAAPEAVACPVPPTAPETTPAVGGTEGVLAKGPSNTVVVAEETGRELSLVLTSEGHHPPMRDEPPLWWGSPWDPSPKIFTLDDVAEGMEREKLNKGFTVALEALNQARGALQDVIIPTSWVFTWSCLLISFFFIYFCCLTTVFFQSLIARSREKSQFLREHKEDRDRLVDEA